MEQLNDEDCEVLKAVRIDCHRHGLNTGVGAQLYLQATTIETQLYLVGLDLMYIGPARSSKAGRMEKTKRKGNS